MRTPKNWALGPHLIRHSVLGNQQRSQFALLYYASLRVYFFQFGEMAFSLVHYSDTRLLFRVLEAGLEIDSEKLETNRYKKKSRE